MNQELAVAKVVFVPQRKNAPSVSFAGNDNHRAIAKFFQAGIDGVEFVRGVDNRRIQYADGTVRHSEAAKNSKIASIFAVELKATKTVESALFAWMSEPNFAGVTVAI